MNEYISQQGCPSQSCKYYGQKSDEFVAIHDKRKNRLRCRSCGKTWSAHYREFHYGLRSGPAKVRRAADLLRAKIPIRTVARFVKVSPSTVMRWKKKLLINQ